MPKLRGANLRIGLLLRQAYRQATTTFDHALSPLDLTVRHVGVMMILRRERVSTQRDLIRQTGSDKAGMVRTVDDLERLGYLSRTPSTLDRRVADLTLTEAGLQALDSAQRLSSGAAEELFGSLTSTELETLESLLAKLVAPRASGSRRAPR